MSNMHVGAGGGGQLPQDMNSQGAESTKKLSFGARLARLFRGDTKSSEVASKTLDKQPVIAKLPIGANRSFRQLVQDALSSITQRIIGNKSQAPLEKSKSEPRFEPLIDLESPHSPELNESQKAEEGVAHMVAFLGDRDRGFAKQTPQVKEAALHAYFGKTGGDINTHMMRLLENPGFQKIPQEIKNAVFDLYLALGGDDAGKNVALLIKEKLKNQTSPDSILRGNTVEKLLTRFYENRLGKLLNESDQFRATLEGAKGVKDQPALQEYCKKSWNQMVDFVLKHQDPQIADLHREMHEGLSAFYSKSPSKEMNSGKLNLTTAPQVMVANALFLRLISPAIFNAMTSVNEPQEKEALKNLSKVIQNLVNLAGSEGGGAKKAASREGNDPIAFSPAFVDDHKAELLQLAKSLVNSG